MIRYRTAHPRREADLDSAMTPMIDVVFLLLVFFVCTASFRIIEQMLPGALSAAPAGQSDQPDTIPEPAADFEQVVLRIGWDGRQPLWTVNGQALPGVEELRRLLDSLVSIQPDARLILHPQPDVPMEFVINAWDWSRLAGFRTIAFAVNK